MKVLVVDDDPTNCHLFELLINRTGVAMAGIFQGEPEELLDVTTYEGFDAVLLDLMMPRVGGEEVAPFVREHFPQMRIVVITALSRHLLPPGLEDVIDQILFKPSSPNLILEALGVR